jgi:hypothetical protein
MTRQTRLAVLIGGLLLGTAAGTASTAAVVGFYSAAPVVNVLAKHGADDPFPECDDHGTDIVCSVSGGTGGTGEQLAKHGRGRDDPFPECDDHGTDIFCAKA